jgi:hypothetical protein
MGSWEDENGLIGSWKGTFPGLAQGLIIGGPLAEGGGSVFPSLSWGASLNVFWGLHAPYEWWAVLIPRRAFFCEAGAGWTRFAQSSCGPCRGSVS